MKAWWETVDYGLSETDQKAVYALSRLVVARIQVQSHLGMLIALREAGSNLQRVLAVAKRLGGDNSYSHAKV
jgi:hypothetical protein